MPHANRETLDKIKTEMVDSMTHHLEHSRFRMAYRVVSLNIRQWNHLMAQDRLDARMAKLDADIDRFNLENSVYNDIDDL